MPFVWNCTYHGGCYRYHLKLPEQKTTERHTAKCISANKATFVLRTGSLQGPSATNNGQWKLWIYVRITPWINMEHAKQRVSNRGRVVLGYTDDKKNQDVKVIPRSAQMIWNPTSGCWLELRRVDIFLLYWLPMKYVLKYSWPLQPSEAKHHHYPQRAFCSQISGLLVSEIFGWPLAIRHLCFRTSPLSRYRRLTPFPLIRLRLGLNLPHWETL